MQMEELKVLYNIMTFFLAFQLRTTKCFRHLSIILRTNNTVCFDSVRCCALNPHCVTPPPSDKF